LNRLEARSKDMPGIAVPNNAFMGTVGVLPASQNSTSGSSGSRRWLMLAVRCCSQPVDAPTGGLLRRRRHGEDECVRTVPPARTAATVDTKETVVGTTLLFPCFIDGCGLFAGDVHFAMGGGEVAGTAIEMGAKVTLQAKVIPAALRGLRPCTSKAARSSRNSPRRVSTRSLGFRLSPKARCRCFPPTLVARRIAPLANLSEDLTLAARNATLNMIDFLVKTKGLTREQAYVLVSVAVDLNIAQVVDVPNVGVTAILNRDVFQGEVK
jgi:formamidase